MSHRFTDIKVRDQYIIGLTEVITEIFGITEKSQKKSVYNELYGLDDEALIDKQSFVEDYLDRESALMQSFKAHVQKFENMMEEVHERTQLQPEVLLTL